MTEEESDTFYRGCSPRLVGQLYALLGDRGDAQDAMQEAFARAWDRRGRLAQVDDPDAWVRTRRRLPAEPLPGDPDPAAATSCTGDGRSSAPAPRWCSSSARPASLSAPRPGTAPRPAR